jgi:streptogramin lyase
MSRHRNPAALFHGKAVMSILQPIVRRVLSAGARHSLILLAAAAASGRIAPQAQASRLLVSSGDRVLRYAETAGDFMDVFLAAGSGGLTRSQGLAFGPDGSLYVSSQDSQSVLRFDGNTGAVLGVFVPRGSGGLTLPMGLAFGPDGNLYVSSFGTSSILRYDGRTGAFLSAFVPAGSGGLDGPTGVTFGPDGSLYVGCGANNSILRYNGRSGAFIDVFVPASRQGLYAPVDPVFGPDGNLYVNNYYANSVMRYDGKTGASLGAFVPANSGGLSGPTSLVFGPDDNLYIASADNDSILRYQGTNGAFIDPFVSRGSGGLISPAWLLFSPPAAPTGLTTTVVSSSQINLAWTGSGEDEEAFTLWRKDAGGVFNRIAVLSPKLTSFADTGLRPNTAYTYRVRATHGYYASRWSNEASATTLSPPAAPTGLSAHAASSSQINLSWTENSRSEMAVTIWRKNGSADYSRIAVLGPSTSRYADTGLRPNTTYTYRARAINYGGASDWTNEASGTTLR